MSGTANSPKVSLTQAVLCLLLVWGWHLTCYAGEPQPWGIHILWPDTEILNPVPSELPSPLTIQRRLETTSENIQGLEAVVGPYSPELTPTLVSAAREAEEYGSPETALELYRWALHSTRINSGLSTEKQLPLVERILELLREQGDPVEVGRQINYFYRLLGRGAEPWTEQRLQASVRWLSVQSELLASSPWAGKESGVLFVVQHANDMATAVCESAEWQDPWCKAISLEVLKLYYLIDFNIDPLVVDNFGVAQDRFPSPYQQNRDQAPGEYRLRNIESSLGSTARGLIDRALKLFPQDENLLHAKADWLMVKGRHAQALQIYQELQREGHVDFSKPGVLPEMPTLNRDHRFSREWGILSLTAEVAPRGNLKNITLSSATMADDTLSGYARRQLRAMRFRPALSESGEAMGASVAWRIKVLR
ncbi:MAG: hypothetical protein HOH17_04225 [Halieaceae bacterium]|nr:hypothetical protein [Halieaceae bacterium]